MGGGQGQGGARAGRREGRMRCGASAHHVTHTGEGMGTPDTHTERGNGHSRTRARERAHTDTRARERVPRAYHSAAGEDEDDELEDELRNVLGVGFGRA